IGPNADGTIPEIQERVLREAGEWVRGHAAAINESARFDVPGDGSHWFTRSGNVINAFDLSSAPEPRFAGFRGVTSLTTPEGTGLAFHGGDEGVAIDARNVDRHPLGTRYVVSCDGPRHIVLPGAASTAGIGELLADAAPGDIVELSAGRYVDEAFPITVPEGV